MGSKGLRMRDFELVMYSLVVGVLLGASVYHLGFWWGEYQLVVEEIAETECL